MENSKPGGKKPEPRPQSLNSTSDYKERIKNAIKSFTDKNKPRLDIPRRHNESPEKDLQKEVLLFMRANGFHVTVVESKATFNPQQGRYVGSAVKDGFADIVGNHMSGMAVFVELKAPGRKSTLKHNQREFLLSKIETGAFAVCVDNVELLSNQWTRFQELIRAQQYNFAKDFLRTALPRKREVIDDDPLFPD